MLSTCKITNWNVYGRSFNVLFLSKETNRWEWSRHLKTDNGETIDVQIFDGDTNDLVTFKISGKHFTDILIGQCTQNFVKIIINNSNTFKLFFTDDIDRFKNIYFPNIFNNIQKNLEKTLLIGNCRSDLFTDIVPDSVRERKRTFITTRIGKDLPNISTAEILEHQAILIEIYNNLMGECYKLTRIIDPLLAQEKFNNLKELVTTHVFHHLKYYFETKLLTFIFNFREPCDLLSSNVLKPLHKYCSITRVIREINNHLEDIVINLPNVFIIDYNNILNLLGKRHMLYHDYYINQSDHAHLGGYRNHINDTTIDPSNVLLQNNTLNKQYTHEQINAYVYDLVNHIYKISTQQNQIKLVIFDLDDTLWHGTATEFIDDDKRDWLPHRIKMEKWCVLFNDLLKRGIYLSICSKNDYNFIFNNWQKLFVNIPFNIFTTPKINYEPKSKNILEIIRSVNLTPSSVLFIDDNALVREEVKQHINDIHIIGINDSNMLDSNYIPYVLYNSAELYRTYIKDNKPILKDIEQLENIKSNFNKKDFLDSLQIKIEGHILNLEDKNIERVVELTNKTNQFNTTSVRRQLSDVIEYIKNENNIVYYFQVSALIDEVVNDLGIVCIVYITNNHIEQFLMSCRVLGYEIESNVLAFVIKQLSKYNEITATYIKTDFNTPCKDVFTDVGFISTDKENLETPIDITRSRTVLHSEHIKDKERVFTFNKNCEIINDYSIDIIFKNN